MKFRVRAAAIILNEKKELLLVLHKNPVTGVQWWTMPGGGLEDEESAPDAIIREVREECGLVCTPDKLVYVREFLEPDKDIHHVELFFTAKAANYSIIKGVDPELDEQYITEVCFLNRAQIEKMDVLVYPEILRDRFWDDLEFGFLSQTVYLGLHE